MISGILHVISSGSRRRDAPREVHGPYTTLYNRFARWNKAGVFRAIFEKLTSEADGTR